MKILAVDTTSNLCSLAISDNSKILSEITINNNKTHSKYLMNLVEYSLNSAEIKLSDIDIFAVCKGPGSFTGLRIGISAIKGLCFALKKTLIGISSLDALAFQSSLFQDKICAMIDARKGNVYFSIYFFKDNIMTKEIVEQAKNPEDVLLQIKSNCLFIGDGALYYKKIIKEKLGNLAYFTDVISNNIRASSIAYLAFEKFKQGEFEDLISFTPNYIRNQILS